MIALLGGALLAARSLPWAPVDRTEGVDELAREVGRTVERPTLRRAESPEPRLPSGASRPEVAVRVRRRDDRAPVSGAQTRLLRVHPGWPARSVARVGQWVADAVADDAGLATLVDVPVPADSTLRLRVAASGYAVHEAEVFLDDAGTEVEVLLEGEAAVAGRTLDVHGVAVPFVRVCAVDVAATPVTFVTATVPIEPTGDPHGTSDGGGHFEIRGLTPNRVYDLQPLSDGWAPAVPVSRAGGEHRGVVAGARDVRLILSRVVAFKLQCVDAETGAPIPRSAFVLPVPGVAGEFEPWWQPGRPWVGGAGDGGVSARSPRPIFPDPTSGVHVGFVVAKSGVGEGIPLHIDVPGYGGGTVTATRRYLSEVGHAAPDVVRLVRSDARPRGQIRVRETPRDGRYLRSTHRSLEFRSSDGTWEIVAAAKDDDEWYAWDVPVGPAVLRVGDAIGWSHPVDVVVRPAEVGRAFVRYPPLTGAVFRLFTAQGERVYEADRVLPGFKGARKSSYVDALKYTAFAVDHVGRPVEIVCSLVPGSYALSVWKLGLGVATASFDVVEGEVSTVDARFPATGPVR